MSGGPGPRTFLLGVGAQKAGTTWLHKYLTASPQMVRGYRKEYHVFDSSDLADEPWRERNLDMAQADVDLLMKQPWMVTSSDGSDGHPRMFATFPEKYVRYVRERKVIDLATFIRQSTGRTADIYKLDRRGYLRPGYFADVVLFDPRTIADHATYAKPQQFATGVSAAFVNGIQVLKDGAPTGVPAGRFVKGPGAGKCLG